MRWLGGTLVAVAGAMAIAGTAAAAEYPVAVSDYTYTPNTITVAEGDAVRWNNPGNTQPHDVSFDDGSFVQPVPASQDLWSVTRSFPAAGTFRYHCSVHGSFMSGTVVVAQAQSGGGGSSGGSQGPSGQAGAQGQQQSAASTCTSQRRFQIRIRQPRGERLRSARVKVNGKSVAVSKRAVDGKTRLTAQVDLRGLPRGTYTVEITAVTVSGKRLTGTRAYQTCAGKLSSSSLPPL
jgi:plastocyanin